jgi:hypothetical protein
VGDIQFEPGAYPEVWLVKHEGQPCGAVGYAQGDDRWRAAWRGELVGESYESREQAAQALVAAARTRGAQAPEIQI